MHSWGKPSALLLGHASITYGRSMLLGVEGWLRTNKKLGLYVNSYLNKPSQKQTAPVNVSDNWSPGYLACNLMSKLELETTKLLVNS